MKIGIIGALEGEVALLKEAMQVKSEKRKAGLSLVEGMLCDQEVVVVRCGVGKVHAALCAQLLVDDYGVELLINTGIAGSLDVAINIGDIVVATDAVQHDMDTMEFGYKKGQVPGLDVLAFETDKKLAKLAHDLCEEVNPDIQCHMGRIATGDQFICVKETKDAIARTHHALVCEMEGASIGQVAYLNQIPFVIIRAVSDKADDSAYLDYPTFEKQAMQHSSHLVMAMLNAL